MALELASYGEFLETIPDAALLVSGDGRIAFANAEIERLLGYPRGGLLHLPLSALIPPSQRPQHDVQVERYFRAPSGRPMGSGPQFAARRADGSVLSADIMLKPVEVGGQRMVLAMLRDLTAWRRMEAELHAAIERERRLALTDALTGAANRRFFAEVAQREIERSQRYGHVFSLAYMDLDHFKAVNDRSGHSGGDELLRVLVQALASHVRTSDLLARLGGDEFALLLPETEAEGAMATVLKLRDEAHEAMARHDWPVTLSVGVLTCRRVPATVDDLVRAADALMYRAKAGGRNRVVGDEYSAQRP